MKKFAFVLLLVALGVGSYGYYSIFGKPDVQLKTRGKVLAKTDSDTQTLREEDKPRPFVSVERSAETIDGFPSTVKVRDGQNEYVTHYTGQMRRIKPILVLPINVYDIASYVVGPTTGETNQLLDSLMVDGPTKVYVLRFLNSLPGKKISDDIYDQINATFTDVDVDRLKPNIDQFVTQFKGGSKKGDTVYIVWLPNGKVYSGFNTPDKVGLIGHDVPFARAIWRIWAGPQFGETRLSLVSRYAENSKK